MIREKIKKIISMLIIISFLACMFGEQASAADYSRYSGTKKAWYIIRSNKHKASGGASTAKSLKKYNAYYYNNKTKEKVMYLAFDCGYEIGCTKKILNVLKEHNVKAAFFVTKDFVETHPKLCKRMKKEGHIVGNHTMNHPSLPSKSVNEIRKQISGLEEVFKEKTGYELDKFVRPPMGEYSERVLKVLKDMGYTTIFWSIAYYDYDPKNQPGKTYVVNHFKKYYHKGAITLTHNVSWSNTDALDDVIKFLEKKGYRLAPLSELNA